MESIDLTKRFRCPVCGKYEFKFEGSFETCPICDWINDPLYDFRGANSDGSKSYVRWDDNNNAQYITVSRKGEIERN